MSDPHPSTFNIEIDRGRLRNYLRVKFFLGWALPLCFIGTLFSLVGIVEALEQGITSRSEAVLLIVRCVGTGIGISLLVALLFYLVLNHRLASRMAANLEVSVEGAFLRIRQHTSIMSDRKLHFRSIVDYATTQDFLMRYFSIYALQMATTAGGQNSNLIIPGVKDCLRVRDLLADIDHQRESQ